MNTIMLMSIDFLPYFSLIRTTHKCEHLFNKNCSNYRLMVFDAAVSVDSCQLLAVWLWERKGTSTRFHMFQGFSFSTKNSPPPKLSKKWAHILLISPWISTIQLGLDASKGKLQVLFGHYCDYFTLLKFREHWATIHLDTGQLTLVLTMN